MNRLLGDKAMYSPVYPIQLRKRIDGRKRPVMEAVLSKWGNSKGVRFPSEVCNELGIGVGSVARIEVNEADCSVTFKFIGGHNRYSRNKKMTLEEFVGDWTGEKIGEEWLGPDVGAEVVD